jgi:hypothetical protein
MPEPIDTSDIFFVFSSLPSLQFLTSSGITITLHYY